MTYWLARATSILLTLCTTAAIWWGGGVVRAADFLNPAPLSPYAPGGVVDPADMFEARFGVFVHIEGSVDSYTADLNGSLVTPRLWFGPKGWWAFLVPRVEVGGAGNLSNRTSFGYAAALWTIPVWDKLFVEGFVGPAVHNGSLTPTATLNGLGCPVVIRAGASLGYRFNERWSVMGTFEHLSNGKTVFGFDCGTNQAATGSNQGLNNYGVRLGYTF